MNEEDGDDHGETVDINADHDEENIYYHVPFNYCI